MKRLRWNNSLRWVIFPESYRYPTKDFGIFSMGCHPQNTQNEELDPGIRSYDNMKQQKVRGLTLTVIDRHSQDRCHRFSSAAYHLFESPQGVTPEEPLLVSQKKIKQREGRLFVG